MQTMREIADLQSDLAEERTARAPRERLLAGAVLFLVSLLLTAACYREVIPDATPTVDATASAAETATPTPDEGTPTATAQATLTPTTSPTPTTEPTSPTATPVTTPTVTPTAQAQIIHVVQAGENLYRIALRYGTTITAIAEANGIANPTKISVGQRLIIPVSGDAVPTPAPSETTYVVQAGDNLYRIGLRFGVSHLVIASYNGLSDPGQIYVGQVLRIPLP
jgi:LysM repeat protein